MPCDILIAAAAVADYRVVAPHKLKKTPALAMACCCGVVRNPDILATLAGRADRPFCVGFAAETEVFSNMPPASCATRTST